MGCDAPENSGYVPYTSFRFDTDESSCPLAKLRAPKGCIILPLISGIFYRNILLSKHIVMVFTSTLCTRALLNTSSVLGVFPEKDHLSYGLLLSCLMT